MKKRKIRNIFILVFLFIFPLVVGAIYALPLPQYIAVESGDLLSYYSVTFGLYFSFYTYMGEKKKEKIERTKELTPALHIELRKESTQENVFEIKIMNLKKQVLTDVILYDELVCNVLNDSTVLKFALGNTKNTDLLKPDIMILDDDISVDKQSKYPKYVQLTCCDIENNCWVCDFQRLAIEQNSVYVPLAPWIE